MFAELIESLAVALEEKNIPYMIIGGQAVLLYGEPRLTKDIDITLGIDHAEHKKILDIASALQLTPLVDNPAQFVRQTMVLPIQDQSTGIRIDFIFSYSEFERQAIQRGRRIRIGKQAVCYASLEDLIIHKIIAARPRDIEDVQSLLLKNPDFDREYIHRWLNDFDTALDADYLARFDHLIEQAG
ncbi:nucleotidyltransferase [bacterium]|nr:nucleotidyltransferase [candidate division CSSED10-310 bacterium]